MGRPQKLGRQPVGEQGPEASPPGGSPSAGQCRVPVEICFGRWQAEQPLAGRRAGVPPTTLRRALLPQRAAFARWLAELEPFSPRSLFWLGVNAGADILGTEQRRHANANPDSSANQQAARAAVAAMCGACLAQHQRGLEAAQHGPGASLYWQARLGYEIFEFVVGFAREDWQGLPPTEATGVLKAADRALRQIQSTGVLPTAWIEVRLGAIHTSVAGGLPAGHPPAGPVLPAAPRLAAMPRRCTPPCSCIAETEGAAPPVPPGERQPLPCRLPMPLGNTQRPALGQLVSLLLGLQKDSCRPPPRSIATRWSHTCRAAPTSGRANARASPRLAPCCMHPGSRAWAAAATGAGSMRWRRVPVLPATLSCTAGAGGAGAAGVGGCRCAGWLGWDGEPERGRLCCWVAAHLWLTTLSCCLPKPWQPLQQAVPEEGLERTPAGVHEAADRPAGHGPSGRRRVRRQRQRQQHRWRRWRQRRLRAGASCSPRKRLATTISFAQNTKLACMLDSLLLIPAMSAKLCAVIHGLHQKIGGAQATGEWSSGGMQHSLHKLFKDLIRGNPDGKKSVVDQGIKTFSMMPPVPKSALLDNSLRCGRAHPQCPPRAGRCAESRPRSRWVG